MNLEQIELEIENEENLKLNYIRLKRIQEQSKELIASIKGIQRREQLLARERRNKAYNKNRDLVVLRSSIKESFINTGNYEEFIEKVSPDFKISKDDFNQTASIKGLLEKLNHLAQFIK
jgi:hypothetical protein